MTNKLPIALAADAELIKQLNLTKNSLENLEAWLNFSTLKANWYNDESHVIRLSITLLSESAFIALFKNTQDSDWKFKGKELIAKRYLNRKTNQLIMGLSEKMVNELVLNLTFEKNTQLLLSSLLNDFATLYKLDLLPAILK